MVKREEFKILVKGMKSVYTQPAFIPDQDAFNIWYELLKDISYKTLSIAIQKHMMSSSYPPTIADIRGAAAKLTPNNSEMSELEAWSMVRKAIRNSSYHAEEEFNNLPDTVQIAVGSPANLREWASMPTETVESVEQSHFLRAYRVVVDSKKEEAKLSPEVRKVYVERNAQPEGIEHGIISPTAQIMEKQGIPMPEHIKRRVREMMRG